MVLAMALAMASVGFSCMTPAMLLLVGLFDMSLRGFVDILCTSKAHHFDVPLLSTLLESMCDEWFLFSQSHSFIIRTVCSLPPLCGVLEASSAHLLDV
jgi:hypothetical protein